MAEQEREAQCILIVDGDVIVRHAIADYLRHCGYVVAEAATTDEAKAFLERSSATVHAVLCDAEAPGSLNAFQLRSWAAGRDKNVRLIMAGNIESVASKAADLCEEGPHLSRPYDPQAVVHYIRRFAGCCRQVKLVLLRELSSFSLCAALTRSCWLSQNSKIQMQ